MKVKRQRKFLRAKDWHITQDEDGINFYFQDLCFASLKPEGVLKLHGCVEAMGVQTEGEDTHAKVMDPSGRKAFFNWPDDLSEVPAIQEIN